MRATSSRGLPEIAAKRASARESGVTLLVGVLSLLIIIPMAGLSVDVGILYTVRARLQASVDGASLAAARALVLGTSTSAQATSAKQNAVNWFYANFPTSNWGTSNTVMDSTTVNVFDDPTNPHLRNVTVSASTAAPTYFMKWLNFNSVTVSAVGNASRRDVVVMMVLDRSGSMGGVCGTMVTAAKIFTGGFAAGRDMVGLVSFSDDVTLHASPTTNFQTVLGYSNSSGSGTGILDTITCAGGTGTAQAISVAYNELYRTNLPGALNVIMFETDGLPNTLTLNFWDSGSTTAGIAATSLCLDRNGKTKALGGFATLASLPSWTPGVTLGSGSLFANPPAGIVAGVYSSDPSQGSYFDLASDYWADDNYINAGNTPGCGFSATHNSTADFAWFPATDVWGNQLAPALNPYKTVATSGGHVSNSGWTNYHAAALNAADNAAYQARTNPTIPAYFFGIGLGGNSGDQPDFILLQRLTNDPNPDNFNSPAKYQPCASEVGCITYANQPQGTFVFSSNSAALARAFLSVSSQILRLSK